MHWVRRDEGRVKKVCVSVCTTNQRHTKPTNFRITHFIFNNIFLCSFCFFFFFIYFILFIIMFSIVRKPNELEWTRKKAATSKILLRTLKSITLYCYIVALVYNSPHTNHLNFFNALHFSPNKKKYFFLSISFLSLRCNFFLLQFYIFLNLLFIVTKATRNITF